MQVLIDLHYFPNLEYFTVIAKADKVYIEKFENFQKQSFRNRCFIKTAQKVDRLTVPVEGANKGRPLRKVKIDHKDNFAIKHWRSIVTAYGRSPYFEYYEEEIKNVLTKKVDTLFELNMNLLASITKLLGIKTEIEITKTFEKETSDEILDLRNKITKTDSPTFTKQQAYIQVFGEQFDQNLSILDLLFCEGPNALHILKSNSSKLIER
ncbi:MULTISPECIES: WbqC family protein [Flammeovirga]|uniref:WbqC family protein n=1 Tax=Flammeovirga agarivorans TaxID=2726742 RepID=A0A7X8XZ24_9BACT|nr:MULTISPECIES: WbqC family protein [Flammeovirga]NLR94759.1 WbqC family protein [Flammeovirga agarivorans]